MSPFPGDLHGAYLRTELAQRLGPNKLRAALANGTLTPFARNVLVDRTRSADFHTRAAAALLLGGPRAVLTSHSAVRLYGCTAAAVAPIHLLVPYGRRLRSRPDLVVHHGEFAPEHVAELRGLRVLGLVHALADLVCRARPRDALACLDQALAAVAPDHRRRLRGEVATRVLDRPDIRGRRQASLALELATGLPESPAESWLLLILAEAGLPAPVPQFSVLDVTGRERYRLDFAWPELKIAVEYDGYEAHEGRAELDAARDEDLRRRGWIVVRAAAVDLKEPARLLRDVRTAFARRQVAA